MDVKESSIIKYFAKRKHLSAEEIDFLNIVFERKIFQKGEIIINKGEICNSIFFIEKGVLKTFFIDDFSKESINGIAIDNNFCTAVSSFINRLPSTEIIEALEETILIGISHENFKILIEKYPNYKNIYIKILEDYLSFMTWRIESVMIMDSLERYKTLMRIFPKLFLRVSNKDMAAYLGMSAETLSRIKSKK